MRTMVTVSKAASLVGLSPPTLYNDTNSGKLPYSVNKAGRKIIDVADLEDVYGIEIEELEELKQSRVIIENLNNQIKSMEDHIETLRGQLATETERNNTLLRIIDPEQNSAIDIFLEPYLNYFKQ